MCNREPSVLCIEFDNLLAYTMAARRVQSVCRLVCVNLHSTSTAIHMRALINLTLNHDMWLLAQPCCFKLNESGWDCEDPEVRKVDFWHCVWFNFALFLLRESLCALKSPNTVETVRKHHLLPVQRRLFVNSRLIGPLKYNAAFDWLRVSCWPKVDSQRVAKAGSKKFQPHNCTMRLPWVGLE